MSADSANAALAEFARVAKAMANPARLHLLDLLSQAERSVDDLAGTAKMPIGNTSAQLKVLRDAGLVCSRREGTRIFYRLAGEDVALLYANLRRVSKKRALEPDTVRAWSLMDTPEAVMTREELLRRRGDGRTMLIDVRPVVEYGTAHIPGAVSIPLEDLRERMAEIPVGVEVVAYCRSSHCLLAMEAVWLLRSHGRCARPLEEGMLEWRLQRLPCEAGRPPIRRPRPVRHAEHREELVRAAR
ncbi:ArsR/SmtB family transcription factor [Nonomuraea wenchangensis]